MKFCFLIHQLLLLSQHPPSPLVLQTCVVLAFGKPFFPWASSVDSFRPEHGTSVPHESPPRPRLRPSWRPVTGQEETAEDNNEHVNSAFSLCWLLISEVIMQAKEQTISIARYQKKKGSFYHRRHQRQHHKWRIWLVERRKISVLHVQHAL